MHARSLSTVLIVALPLSACLSEGGRQGRNDTTSDTGHETSDDIADTMTDAEPDTSDPCQDKLCDDDDECTYDYCNVSTGLCEHIALPSTSGADAEAPGDPAAPPEPPCEGTCEDNDPCTVDQCVFVPDTCAVQGFYTCVHAPIVDCGTCANGCDDRDPCTIDACLDGHCIHSPIESCMSHCIAAQTRTISEVIATGSTPTTKTVGELFFHPKFQACDDGPDCGCFGFPGLRDPRDSGDQALVLDHPSGFDPDSWQCTSTGCATVATTCAPAQFGVRYRVWGRPIADWEVGSSFLPDPGAIPPLEVAGLAVEDFCLETVASSLAGHYTGLWDIADETARFKASIRVDVAPQIELSAIECSSGTICPQSGLAFTAPLTVGDGWVDIDVSNAPFPFGGDRALRLYSHRNTLAGRYGDDTVVPFDAGPPRPDTIFPSGGSITLTRVAPAR